MLSKEQTVTNPNDVTGDRYEPTVDRTTQLDTDVEGTAPENEEHATEAADKS